MTGRGQINTENMGKEERERFLKWYEEESARMKEQSLSYDLRKEMIKYCYDDCFVLASAFSHFNESMIKELKDSGVKDIIEHDFTILADFITLPQLVCWLCDDRTNCFCSSEWGL